MNRKNKKMSRYKGLDKEELKILTAFDEGHLSSVKEEKVEASRLKKGAHCHKKLLFL